MPIQWRDQLSIDGGPIDADHKTLIAIINDFEAVKPGPDAVATMDLVLGRLEQYAEVHFRREEQLQLKVAFPFARAHNQQHRLLMRNVAAARGEFAAVASGSDLAMFRSHMCRFLNDWLLGHIVQSDLLMKPYVKAMAPYAARLGDLHAAVRSMAGEAAGVGPG